MLADDTAGGGKYRSVLSFSKTSYYYVFRRDRMDLKNKVDTAAAEIFAQDPLYEQTLRQKYGISSGALVSLTKEEKAYIAAKPYAAVAVVEHDNPYYSTGSDGQARGVLPDLYAEISRDTGLHFRFQAYPTQAEAAGAVLSGEADILGIFSDGLPYAYSAGFRLTYRYSSVSLVMIKRAETKVEDIQTIAVKKRSFNAVKRGIPGELANASLVDCSTAAECFAAVKQGSADALIVALPSATWIINQTNSAPYSFVPLSGTGIDLSAAVPYGNRLLTDILSKGISQASDLFNGIVSNNTASENSLQAAVARIPAAAIVTFAAVMLFMVLFLTWAVASLVKSRRTKVAAVEAAARAEEQRIKAEAIEKSAEEKNAFFSNISHDMRTPLNGILGFADLAAQQDSLDKAQAYIAKIKLSGDLLLGLINDTLTISKISSGKLELRPAPLDTTLLQAGISSSIHALADRKGVDFTVDDSGLRRRTVLADKLNLEKIFLNLLSNAVKFTPPGGHVRCTVRDEDAGGPEPDIVVTVQDDGIGMSEEYMCRMYEPFSQEKRHGYDSVGTGLGLSIVKQLVELMGGTIEARSKVGEGTVFTVRLRLPETAAVAPAQSTPPAPGAFAALRGKKVLLCEDNPLNREITESLLSNQGMCSAAAENGQEGVELFSRSAPGEFAAILMDLRMPVMDGLEAARAIRALDRPDAAAIPILAMTADAFPEDVQRCLAAGMTGHIAKPIDPGQFYRLLAQQLTPARS